MSPFSWLCKPLECGRSCYSGDIFPLETDNFYDHDFPNSGSNFDYPALHLEDGEPLFSEGLTFFLGFGFLLSFDLDNKSTGFASLPPLETFNILVRLLNSDALSYSNFKMSVPRA